MIIFSSFIVTLILLILKLVFKTRWYYIFIGTIVSMIITSLVISIDYNIKTTDTEIWSGTVVDWKHNEEWDEWIPETCTTNDDGWTSCSGGYWEHHNATNHIKTTDAGWITVTRTPDGEKMNDHFPNRTEELMEMWLLGTPSASTHIYRNKVKASYSIYRHQDIDLNKYSDLPKYPKEVRDYIHVDRIVGEFPNREEALITLADKNAWLNQMIPDPEKQGKKRSWKQVNIIFVNMKNTTEDYGFALQDYWGGGNKNDFVVVLSTDDNNNVLWVYPFSWSESELLKIEVRDYMLNLKTVTDTVPVIEDISNLVADKFERKQFADFNYLQIDVSSVAKWFIFILNILIIVLVGVVAINDRNEQRYYHRRYY